jgi:hypothetical protein
MNGDFIKKVFLGAFIWQLVRYFFKYPLRMTIILAVMYIGGRYMLFNHPETVSNGIRAVKDEAVKVGNQIGKVTNDSLTKPN